MNHKLDVPSVCVVQFQGLRNTRFEALRPSFKPRLPQLKYPFRQSSCQRISYELLGGALVFV